jgi:hypothetical protein
MGGVAAYLLTGLTWALGYRLLLERRPDAIHFQSSIAGSPTGEPSRLIHFSLATLTSVSYGDAYPIHRVARSMAMAEALIGHSNTGRDGAEKSDTDLIGEHLIKQSSSGDCT